MRSPEGRRGITKATLGEPVMDFTSVGDVWEACWADDDRLYVSSDDSLGFGNQPGGNLHFNVLEGDRVENLTGRTLNLMTEYGPMTAKGPDNCMWKANGNTCIDGVIYLFVSRHGLDFLDEANARQRALNSSLIRSMDKGLTWQRSARENYDAPMFPGPRFGSPFFVKYGRDGQASVHQADRYVYAVANDGYWENGNDLILGRVARDRIGRLDSSDWQFLSGPDGGRDEAWSADLAEAEPILVNSGKCSMTGIQYIEPLERYLMIQWYYPKGAGHAASDETIWIFYEAPAPWGPWKEFHTQTFFPQGYYNPCILAKFIRPDGLHLEILTNGDFQTLSRRPEGEKCLYRLTRIPCTLSLAECGG